MRRTCGELLRLKPTGVLCPQGKERVAIIENIMPKIMPQAHDGPHSC